MSLSEGYRIGSSNAACCDCGVEFSAGQGLFSALREAGDGFERIDYCTACWQRCNEAGGWFCHWRTRRPQASARRVLDTDLMVEFFDRLAHAEDADKRAFRFVLALYLARRKELKLLGVRRNAEGEALLFERRGTGIRVEVQDPHLGQQQIEEAAVKLGRLFDADL